MGYYGILGCAKMLYGPHKVATEKDNLSHKKQAIIQLHQSKNKKSVTFRNAKKKKKCLVHETQNRLDLKRLNVHRQSLFSGL